jgi:hypothetical protein
MRRTFHAIAAALCAALVLMACSRQQQAESATAADADAMQAVPDEARAVAGAAAADAAAAPQATVDPSQLVSGVGTNADPRRRFVLTAHARFRVRDVYATALAIEDAAVALGGHVVSNRIGAQVQRTRSRKLGDGQMLQLSEYATSGALTLRVPSERTQSFLRGLARQMEFLDEREFEARDVQFDLLRRQLAEARARALRDDIGRAAAQGGKTGERVDAATSRADAVNARDEAVVAQQELEDQIAYSTVRLDFSQPAQVRQALLPDTDTLLERSGPGFFHQLGQALQSGWRGLLDALVVIALLWPLWVAIAALVLGYRWLRRRNRGGRS